MSFRGLLPGLCAVPVVVGGYADVRAAEEGAAGRGGGRPPGRGWWLAYGVAGLTAVTVHLGLRRGRG
ncbi:hypothetical protein G3I32_35760 [Streptomyces coelicoflavus]|uniref:Uncharacterized protein n=1 Tax=Streptomyces coelicoflavus TaxID=285562 RepID=A0A7K3PVW6_9ACTN|nr:hypothetical protein [Streptomyces coelicoflavus]NEB14126.1 hypothetical protein [Streptomyces coelicoflavus]